jgi:hypothetical protein
MNDLIAGRYAVVSTLGEGGGGVVDQVLDQARGIVTALGGRLLAKAEEGDDGQA